MLKYWIITRISQIILDIALVYGGFQLAYFVRTGWIFSTDFPYEKFALFSGMATLIWVGFMVFAKYYRVPPRSGKRELFDLALVIASGALANGILIVTYFFPLDEIFSRLISVYAFLFGSALLIISHVIFDQIFRSIKKSKKASYQTLIVGANRVAEKLIEAIENNPHAPYQICGVIDPYGMSHGIKGAEILGKLDKLESVCDEKKISAIIQCDALEHTLSIIGLCDERHIKFQFDPALRGIFEGNLRIREVAGQTMISFVQRDFKEKSKGKLYKAIDWVMRQVFDVD